ncbi:MAG TPA: winged helix-turn-helix domain-containing protein [Paludibacter sp.]
MEIEEIGLKIKDLKSQAEMLKKEIEKVNSETKRMMQDLQATTLKLKQMPRVQGQPAQVSRTQNKEWLTRLNLTLQSDMLAILSAESYQIGLFTLRKETRMLTFGNNSYHLTQKEFLLLAIFAANQNVFLSREFCLVNIWGEDTYYNSRSMDVYICKLRKLLAEDSGIHIVNKHGQGYIMLVDNKN